MTICFRLVALRNRAFITATVSALTVCFTPISAQAADLDISTRADIRRGSGKPVNDVLGYALVVRYGLNQPG